MLLLKVKEIQQSSNQHWQFSCTGTHEGSAVCSSSGPPADPGSRVRGALIDTGILDKSSFAFRCHVIWLVLVEEHQIFQGLYCSCTLAWISLVVLSVNTEFSPDLSSLVLYTPCGHLHQKEQLHCQWLRYYTSLNSKGQALDDFSAPAPGGGNWENSLVVVYP